MYPFPAAARPRFGVCRYMPTPLEGGPIIPKSCDLVYTDMSTTRRHAALASLACLYSNPLCGGFSQNSEISNALYFPKHALLNFRRPHDPLAPSRALLHDWTPLLPRNDPLHMWPRRWVALFENCRLHFRKCNLTHLAITAAPLQTFRIQRRGTTN